MTVIKIKAQIQPTEDPEKITKAITNLFGNIQLNHDHEENMITGKIEEITQLKELRNRIAQEARWARTFPAADSKADRRPSCDWAAAIERLILATSPSCLLEALKACKSGMPWIPSTRTADSSARLDTIRVPAFRLA